MIGEFHRAKVSHGELSGFGVSGSPSDLAKASESEVVTEVVAHLVREVLGGTPVLVGPVEVLEELLVVVALVHVDVEHVRARSVVAEYPLEVHEFGCSRVDESVPEKPVVLELCA